MIETLKTNVPKVKENVVWKVSVSLSLNATTWPIPNWSADNYFRGWESIHCTWFTARSEKLWQAIYPKLAPVALDILAAPASQAYVERLFSVRVLLSLRRRHRMIRWLTVRVSLKINMGILRSTGVLRLTQTRCSAIAERPRCRVRYSFPQK